MAACSDDKVECGAGTGMLSRSKSAPPPSSIEMKFWAAGYSAKETYCTSATSLYCESQSHTVSFIMILASTVYTRVRVYTHV